MNIFDTIAHTDYFVNVNQKDGCPEAAQPHEKIVLYTDAGSLVPIYSVVDHGRRQLAPVRLHANGTIKSLSLQESTVIKTPIGEFSAELVTFYESGAIARVFPLNGKLSGYWSELNEYKLATKTSIPTPLGIIEVRPIYLHFYETGELKSVTFWPGEQLNIRTPIGELAVKRGLSFHQNGALASCEPVSPVTVETPLGVIDAYDPDPNGMSGEKNSLSFTECGDIAGLSTVAHTVLGIVLGTQSQTETISFAPMVKRSRCSDTAFELEPLKIKFEADKVVFRNGMRPAKTLPVDARVSLKPFRTDKKLGGASCCS
ncbi:MAG: hypothetical protein JXR76_10650 [Deltaproteobacteria bacterium]|nr:hypothetical protein [Deltaproteobacteria bacterium]